MAKSHNPKTVAPPFSRYSHGIEVPASARWLWAIKRLMPSLFLNTLLPLVARRVK